MTRRHLRCRGAPTLESRPLLCGFHGQRERRKRVTNYLFFAYRHNGHVRGRKILARNPIDVRCRRSADLTVVARDGIGPQPIQPEVGEVRGPPRRAIAE